VRTPQVRHHDKQVGTLAGLSARGTLGGVTRAGAALTDAARVSEPQFDPRAAMARVRVTKNKTRRTRWLPILLTIHGAARADTILGRLLVRFRAASLTNPDHNSGHRSTGTTNGTLTRPRKVAYGPRRGKSLVFDFNRSSDGRRGRGMRFDGQRKCRW